MYNPSGCPAVLRVLHLAVQLCCILHLAVQLCCTYSIWLYSCDVSSIWMSSSAARSPSGSTAVLHTPSRCTAVLHNASGSPAVLHAPSGCTAVLHNASGSTAVLRILHLADEPCSIIRGCTAVLPILHLVLQLHDERVVHSYPAFTNPCAASERPNGGPRGLQVPKRWICAEAERCPRGNVPRGRCAPFCTLTYLCTTIPAFPEQRGCITPQKLKDTSAVKF
jgi:hypothetical protein